MRRLRKFISLQEERKESRKHTIEEKYLNGLFTNFG